MTYKQIHCNQTFIFNLSGNPLASQLSADFNMRVSRGFRPPTLAAYKKKFRLYLSFLVHLEIQSIDSIQAVSLFVEFLAQQGFRAQTITNYLTVLKHFFAIYDLNLAPLEHRLIKLAVRAVAYNAPLSFRIKGTITVLISESWFNKSLPFQMDQHTRQLY